MIILETVSINTKEVAKKLQTLERFFTASYMCDGFTAMDATVLNTLYMQFSLVSATKIVLKMLDMTIGSVNILSLKANLLGCKLFQRNYFIDHWGLFCSDKLKSEFVTFFCNLRGLQNSDTWYT